MAPRLSRRTGTLLGVALIVAAVVLGLVLFVFAEDAGDPDAGRDGGDTAPDLTAPGEDAPTPADPDDPLPEATELADGRVLDPVARVPGATALSLVDGELRATDTRRGIRYTVDAATGERSDPTPFGALSRLARSEPSPSGDVRWVADGSSLHRLDPDSGKVLETLGLEVPGAVTAVTDAAVWLTVSGLPDGQGAHGGAPVSVVQRVDAATGEVRAITLEDPVDVRFALGPDAAYVTVGRTVYRLDPTTAEVTAEGELDEPATALLVAPSGPDADAPSGPDADAGSAAVLAVVGGADAHVARLDPATLEPLDRVALPAGTTGDAALVGPELWVLRPDDDAVDVVAPDPSVAAPDEPLRLDVEGPRRLVADADGAWLITSGGDGVLARIDRGQSTS